MRTDPQKLKKWSSIGTLQHTSHISVIAETICPLFLHDPFSKASCVCF